MLQGETGNSWSILGHTVPLLGQPLVKNQHTQPQSGTATGDPKASICPHQVPLHHSISSEWVQQRMLQGETGNSWSILGHAVPLLGQRRMKNQHTATERTGDLKASSHIYILGLRIHLGRIPLGEGNTFGNPCHCQHTKWRFVYNCCVCFCESS
jgi:hypothetical protein